jgi:hypothetical protein
MAYSRDTSPEAERVQIELLRKLTPARKLRLLSELNELGRQLVMAGLRQRHPGATREELEREYARLTLGPDLAAEVLAARQPARGSPREVSERP